MKRFIFLAGLFLTSCLVDTQFPVPSGPFLLEPVCGNVEELYWEMGNPAYCYPDQCCVWEYYDYDGWLCEETWCEYRNASDCWWTITDVVCW
jgi:hypothetical protein